MPKNRTRYPATVNHGIAARTKSALGRTQKAAQAHLPSTIWPAPCVRAGEMCGWH